MIAGKQAMLEIGAEAKLDDLVVMQVANNRFDEGQLGKAKMEASSKDIKREARMNACKERAKSESESEKL